MSQRDNPTVVGLVGGSEQVAMVATITIEASPPTISNFWATCDCAGLTQAQAACNLKSATDGISDSHYKYYFFALMTCSKARQTLMQCQIQKQVVLMMMMGTLVG